MKCPVCGIEMRLAGREDGRAIWVCRNAKCQEHEKNEEREESEDASE